MVLLEEFQIINVEGIREVETSPLEHSRNCYSQNSLMGANNQGMKVWEETEYL